MSDDNVTPLDLILERALLDEESQGRFDRERLLADHPLFASDLAEFFANRDRFKRLARPMSGEVAASHEPARVRYFGDYELLGEIARGGMGVVYRAKQQSLNRVVAVKMLLAEHLATEAEIRRFREEARLAANLRHHAVVPIHEIGQHQGQHFFSMEYIEGRDLARVMQVDPPTPRQSAEIIKQVAEAVHYAHSQGVVHRDIKPSNVLLDEQDRVHVTDFGLAMRVEGDCDLTRTGQILGTPGYMAPEQTLGQREAVGASSDIFSMGALLYEMITLRPPFRGESIVETLKQSLEDDPILPRRFDAAIPSDLETICLKCLEKDPGKRYASAALLADDLGRYLAGEPIDARRISHWDRFHRWCLRNPAIASLTCCSALLLVAVAVTATVGYWHAEKQRVLAVALKHRAEVGEDDAQRNLEQLSRAQGTIKELENTRTATRNELNLEQHRLYQTRIELARTALQSGRIKLADNYLDLCPPEFRQRDYFHLKRQCRPRVQELDGARVVAVSPQGTRIATTQGALGVQVVSVENRQMVSAWPGTQQPVSALAFSPTGDLLAIASGQTITLWNLSTGEIETSLGQRAMRISDVAFSPDGRHLAWVTERTREKQGRVTLWNLALQREDCTWDGIEFVAFSPDGNHLATGNVQVRESEDDRYLVSVWDIREAENSQIGLTTQIPTKSGIPAAAAFSPEGYIAAVNTDGYVEFWDYHSKQLIRQLPPMGLALRCLAFDREGTRLACGGGANLHDRHSARYEVMVWNLRVLERDWVLPWYRSPVSEVHFAADGNWLATATLNEVKLWDVEPPKDPTAAILSDILDLDVGKYDWPQWGGSKARINTPAGRNIPSHWSVGESVLPGFRERQRPDKRRGLVPEDSVNIKWLVRLGSQTYGNPVVANGRIFVGTNNGAGYLDKYPINKDLGVLLCFEEASGRFLWQHSNEKLPSGRVHDWPLQGVCSTPVVDGSRLWYVSNRGEVVCLDTEGFYDLQDDGPLTNVRTQLFTVQYEALPTHNYYGSPSHLREHFARFNVPLPNQVRIGPSPRGPRRWLVSRVRGESPELYEVILDAERLRVFGLNDQKEPDVELFSLSTVRYPELQQGRLDQHLREQFAAIGISLPERVKVERAGRRRLANEQADEPAGEEPAGAERRWTFEATINGVSRMFELIVQGPGQLTAYELAAGTLEEADVIWKFDMFQRLQVNPHNMSNCSMITAHGLLFVCTSNGVDESHVNLPSPDAPSFVALNRDTGEVVWTSNLPGHNILHAQWASPSYGVFNGKPQVIFPGGDGWIYSFDPLGDGQGNARLLWKFDANPKESQWVLGGRGERNNVIAFPAIYDGLVYIVAGQDPEHGEGPGLLWCIDPTRRLDGGDVSSHLAVDAQGNPLPHRKRQAVIPENGERAIPNPYSAVRWQYVHDDQNGDGEIDFEEEFHRSLSIPVIKDDLLYVADFSGLFHCLNAKTGKVYWTCDLLSQVWGSALLVDGKVYIADEDGLVHIFRHSADPSLAMKDGQPINTDRPIEMLSSVYMTPIVANNVLYIVDRIAMYAISNLERDNDQDLPNED